MAGARMAWCGTFAVLLSSLGCVNLDKQKDKLPPEMPARGQVDIGGKAGKATDIFAQQQKQKANSLANRFKQVLPHRKPQQSPNTPSKLDPTSLAHVPTKPLGADLHVAAARLAEKSGRYDQALQQYQTALQKDGKSRTALIGLARLHHRIGNMPAAIAVYRDAHNVYRDDPVIMNDLGLSYARNGQLDEAISVLRRATQVAPEREMYRNNLAATLIEANRTNEAVAGLTRTYGPAIANYNIGYLLQNVGRNEEAAQYLTRSLEHDPNMEQARILLDQTSPRLTARTQVETETLGIETQSGEFFAPLDESTPQSHALSTPFQSIPTTPSQASPSDSRAEPNQLGPLSFSPIPEGQTAPFSDECNVALVAYEAELLGTVGEPAMHDQQASFETQPLPPLRFPERIVGPPVPSLR